MKAYIRGGEHILKMDNNKSLLKMFELKTNTNDHIDLYDDIQDVVFVLPQVDKSKSYDKTIVILDDEESQSIRFDGVERQGMDFDEKGFIKVQVAGIESQGVNFDKAALIVVEMVGET